MVSKKISMTREEWNKAIDAHLEGDKKLVGKERVLGSKSEIGMAAGVEYDKVVTARLISVYTKNCMGNTDPLYTDPGYGNYTRWGSMIAPPTFIRAMGGPSYYINPMSLPGVLNMHKGTKYIRYKPIRPGDEITFTQKYLGYEEKPVKEGKPYRLFTTEIVMNGYNQRDELVEVQRRGQLITATYPEGDGTGKKPTLYGERDKISHYTEEELEKVHNFYDDELAGKHRRGAEIRYWEEVNEGDDITPLLEGPVDYTDLNAYWCGLNWFFGSGSFAAKWQSARNTPPEHRLIDPDTGEVVNPGTALHCNDKWAKLVGVPRAVTDGYMNDAGLAHLVCNWMGDDAWLKVLDTQNRGMRFTGDMSYLQGKVAKKYIEDGEHLVDLDLKSTIPNAKDAVQSLAKATVRLISRLDE